MRRIAIAALVVTQILAGPVAALGGEEDTSAAHPAKSSVAGARGPMPDFEGRDAWARSYRTRIRDALRYGPNFAGHYSMIEIGCGTSCRIVYVADTENGEVIAFPYGGEKNSELMLDYGLESSHVEVQWKLDYETCIRQKLDFDGREFAVLHEETFQRIDFCNP